MGKATLIQNSAKSNLVILFKHFSDNFKFDLCLDFTFWKAETGRCIPKKMNNDEEYVFYTYPPLCNRTEFDCIYGKWPQYCPNVADNCELYNLGEHFFCKNSKTCIPKGELFSFTQTLEIV